VKKCILLALLIIPAFGDEPKPFRLVTNSGRVYEKTLIQSSGPLGVSIQHSSGTANLYWADLPQWIREKHGFNPEKEEEFRISNAEAQAKAREAMANAAEQRKVQSAEQAKIRSLVREKQRNAVSAGFEVLQIIEGGVLAFPYSISYARNENTPWKNNRKTESWTRIQEKPVAIVMQTTGVTRGSRFKKTVYPEGMYSYHSTNGTPMSVLKYYTSAYMAAEVAMRPLETTEAPKLAVEALPLRPEDDKAAPIAVGMVYYKSKVKARKDDLFVLENGAIIEVRGFASVLSDEGDDAVLIKDGPLWKIWVEGSSLLSGDLINEPELRYDGTAENHHITDVLGNGSILKTMDDKIFKVDNFDRVQTSIWIGYFDAVVLDNNELIHADQSEEIIEVEFLQ